VVFSAVVFTLDVLAGLLFPNWWVMQNLYELLLPGYTFISLGMYFLGLVEIFTCGFLTAVLFVPIYNFFALCGGQVRLYDGGRESDPSH